MGLEIVEPGCGRVRLAPKNPGFDYTISYPTPKGDITVECVKGDIRIRLPEGVERVG